MRRILAYSSEAFELWYLLRFHFHNTPMPRQDYPKKLSKVLGRVYRKNSETIYEELLDNQPTAVRNAKKLMKLYDPPNPRTISPLRPSTNLSCD
jgi:hypothetical protein